LGGLHAGRKRSRRGKVDAKILEPPWRLIKQAREESERLPILLSLVKISQRFESCGTYAEIHGEVNQDPEGGRGWHRGKGKSRGQNPKICTEDPPRRMKNTYVEKRSADGVQNSFITGKVKGSARS